MKPWFSSTGRRGIKCLSVLLGLLPAGVAPAALLTVDTLSTCGRVYRNVTVLDYNVTDAYFTHAGGMMNIKLRYLDPELQKRFRYDPDAATRAEERQADDDRRYNQLMVSNMVAQAKQAALAARKAASTSPESLADPVSARSLIGKPAPAIKGEKWLGEKPETDGKLMLVAFWEPWSIPCRKYIAELTGLQKKFPEKLAVVGVTSESEAEIEEMTGPKPDFASLLDPKAQLGTTVGVTSVPYVMLVDAKGVVRYQGHPTAITEKQVQSLLAKVAE